MKKLLLLAILLLPLSRPSLAWAGDAATVIFSSGQVVRLTEGYPQILEAMRTLNQRSAEHKILELKLGGDTFLLNVAEVVVVCREECRSLKYVHQLDPSRGKP